MSEAAPEQARVGVNTNAQRVQRGPRPVGDNQLPSWNSKFLLSASKGTQKDATQRRLWAPERTPLAKSQGMGGPKRVAKSTNVKQLKAPSRKESDVSTEQKILREDEQAQHVEAEPRFEASVRNQTRRSKKETEVLLQPSAAASEGEAQPKRLDFGDPPKGEAREGCRAVEAGSSPVLCEVTGNMECMFPGQHPALRRLLLEGHRARHRAHHTETTAGRQQGTYSPTLDWTEEDEDSLARGSDDEFTYASQSPEWDSDTDVPTDKMTALNLDDKYKRGKSLKDDKNERDLCLDNHKNERSKSLEDNKDDPDRSLEGTKDEGDRGTEDDKNERDGSQESEPSPLSVFKAASCPGTPVLGKARRQKIASRCEELRQLLDDLNKKSNTETSLGSMQTLTPMRVPKKEQTLLGSNKAVTPVRRSLRNSQTVEPLDSMLTMTNSCYKPNPAIQLADTHFPRIVDYGSMFHPQSPV